MEKHTEAKIESNCPEVGTLAKILTHWQVTLKIQIKEKKYKINNCQISFLYDVKLAARLSLCTCSEDSQVLVGPLPPMWSVSPLWTETGN